MKRLIVGVDGSMASLHALRWAVHLAQPLRAGVIAIGAFSAWSETKAQYLKRVHREHAEQLQKWCNGVIGDASITVEAVHGDPREVLLEAIARHDADTLVLASTGRSRSAPGFLHIGSVVESVAHRVEVPLAIVPADASVSNASPLVALDGSVHAGAAASWLAEIAAAAGSTVYALTVEKPPAVPPIDDDDRWEDQAKHRISSDWARPLIDRGVKVLPIARRDLDPADGIMRTVAERDIDLIAMGMRGAGGVSGIRFGGVAFKVMHRAEVPLVLIPPG